MTKLTFLAEYGCMSSSISGAVDAFSIANVLWQLSGENDDQAPFKTEVVSVDGLPIEANGGLIVQPNTSISDMDNTDVIVVPAFLPPINIDQQRLDAINSCLTSHHNDGGLIASTCTGTFLLAGTGLLDGKLATTNWQFAAYFRKLFPKVRLRIDRIFTEDSGIYCTGAATAMMDLCLYFIETFGSKDLARRCSKALLVDKERSSQSPYIIYDFWKNHSDQEVLKSQKLMEKKYTEKISMDEIAEKAGLSPRHFKRRFKNATGESPLAYLQLLRIENAKHRLETGRDTINEITWHVGYEDINSFRRLYKKHTGMSPKQYRNKFSW